MKTLDDDCLDDFDTDESLTLDDLPTDGARPLFSVRKDDSALELAERMKAVIESGWGRGLDLGLED